MGIAAKTLSNIVNNNSTKPKVATPLNNDFLQQFDAFNLNSSPAPSHHSSTSHHSTSKPNHQKSQTALDTFADFDDFAATGDWDQDLDLDWERRPQPLAIQNSTIPSSMHLTTTSL